MAQARQWLWGLGPLAANFEPLSILAAAGPLPSIGYGKTMLIAATGAADGLAPNRRIEFLVKQV